MALPSTLQDLKMNDTFGILEQSNNDVYSGNEADVFDSDIVSPVTDSENVVTW
jgi:hypothetical protein